MFKDLDDTLAKLLKQELPQDHSHSLGISFATPDEEFPTHSTIQPPLVNLFLYDIRENLDLRSNEWTVERNNGNVTRQRPPVRVNCSYLVTAWASASDTSSKVVEQEHWILGAVAEILVRYPTIPESMLRGKLQGQQPPLPTLALNSGHLQSPSEFWHAMGGKPRPALHYTVTVSLEPSAPEGLGKPVLQSEFKFYQGVPGGNS